MSEISKVAESANKNLDNALTVAVSALAYMRDNCLEYAADYMDKADEALQRIAAILKVRQKDQVMASCCDKAIDNGTLVYKGRATIVCPTCGKDQMLKLVFFHDCGYEYIDGKGLKKANAEQKDLK